MYNDYLHIKSLKLAVILFDSTFLSLFMLHFVKIYYARGCFYVQGGAFFTLRRGGKIPS